MSEKMIFCLGDGRWENKGEGYQKNLRIFNQDVSEDEYNKTLSLLGDNEIKIQLTKWVDYKNLDKDDQTSTSKQLGGLLKVFTYEEAWKNFWDKATQEQKSVILDIPQFDNEIFKSITGIDVKQSKNPTEITIDGAKYRLVE